EGLHTYYVLAGATPVLVHDADDLCGVTSAIHDDPYLVKAAEAAGRNQRLQKEMDDLVMQFRSGNKNPGLGNKALEGTDISYLRGRNGGRVFIPEHRRRDPDRRQGGQIEREQGHQPSQGALRKLTMYEISENGLTLRVELGGDEPDEVENADGWVLVPGGGEWSATFLTHREMGRVMERWRSTGECLGGAYFTCPDLVVTRRPGGGYGRCSPRCATWSPTATTRRRFGGSADPVFRPARRGNGPPPRGIPASGQASLGARTPGRSRPGTSD